jgi:nicotinate-nucleotide--dimethylbenzimidazole phosphoribosyltransferase
MGIGNTSSAAAIASVLLNRPVTDLVGPGTGLNDDGVNHKADLLATAIEKHKAQLISPLEILRHLGGFEIGALVGAYIYCAQQGLPVIIDGYIATTAALLAEKMLNNCSDWFIFSHQSAEPGHRLMMYAFEQTPLLNFGMRLGEASGAASLVPIIKLSLALHNDMATFAEAAVSGKIE